jgi:hypothetical protein
MPVGDLADDDQPPSEAGDRQAIAGTINDMPSAGDRRFVLRSA